MLREEGFCEALLTTLDLLTHKKDDSYDDYVRKLAEDPTARRVKIADLEDNMNLLQCPTISERDLKRTEKYHRYWTVLSRLECER